MHASIRLSTVLAIMLVSTLMLTRDSLVTSHREEFPRSIAFEKAQRLSFLLQKVRQPECGAQYCLYSIQGVARAYLNGNKEHSFASPVRVTLFVDESNSRFTHLAMTSVIHDPSRGLLARIILIDFLTDGVIDVYIEEGVTAMLTGNSLPPHALLQAGSFVDECFSGKQAMCAVRYREGAMMQPDIYESLATGLSESIEKILK